MDPEKSDNGSCKKGENVTGMNKFKRIKSLLTLKKEVNILIMSFDIINI